MSTHNVFLQRNKKNYPRIITKCSSLISPLKHGIDENYKIAYHFFIYLLKKSGPGCSKLVKGHFVNYFSRFNIQFSEIFCWKNVSSFCTAKATHIFFSKKYQRICVSFDVTFNESLTNNVVSFEQLGPD